jgi:hypothetical protein
MAAVSNSNSGALDEMVVMSFTLPIKAYVMDVRLERKLASDINIRVLSAFK